MEFNYARNEKILIIIISEIKKKKYIFMIPLFHIKEILLMMNFMEKENNYSEFEYYIGQFKNNKKEGEDTIFFIQIIKKI